MNKCSDVSITSPHLKYSLALHGQRSIVPFLILTAQKAVSADLNCCCGLYFKGPLPFSSDNSTSARARGAYRGRRKAPSAERAKEAARRR